MTSSEGANDGRTANFSRNIRLETLLTDINSCLWVAERETLERSPKPEYPLILVMGPHRSGTTLFMQWLANSGLVAYPTNLLSRFYQAPIIGAKIQLLLTDPRFNFRDELVELVQHVEYSSENGKTKGVLAPNEFWYFWRRFLAEPARDVWTDEELRQTMDVATMQAELAGMMNVFQKPFASKGMLFNYNIPFFDSVFDEILFVQLRRDLTTNVSSALEARKRQFGSEDRWYSFDIPEKAQLEKLSPGEQAKEQIDAINRTVTTALWKVKESRKLFVQYEHFCEAPAKYFAALTSKIGLPDVEYKGPASFQKSR